MRRFELEFFTRCFFTLITAGGVASAFLAQSAHSQVADPVPAARPVVPVLRDSIAGRGTNFSIVTLNGSTITLTSGQAVEVSLMGRESAVMVYLEAAPPLISVQLSLSGLTPSTTYFIREDGIEKRELLSSAEGEISFTQDVSGPRSLLIQSERSTVYIRANGSIDPPTAPISAPGPGYYFLMANLSEPLVIQRNGIAFYGNGYSITGAGQALGLDVSGRSAVAVFDLTVRGFYTGVSFNNSTRCTFSYSSVIANTGLGITQSGGSNNLYQGNTVKNPADYADQMRVYYASNITVKDSVLGRDGLPDYGYGINLYRTANSTFTRNKISHTNIAFEMGSRSNSNVVSLSTFTSNNLAMEFYWGGNTAENNAVDSNWTGVHLASYYDPYYPPAQYPGSGAPNTIKGNSVQLSRSAGILSEGQNAVIRDNILKNNPTAVELQRPSFIASGTNTVTGNNFTDNNVGVSCNDSREEKVSGNSFSQTVVGAGTGIRFYSGSNNIISGNSTTNVGTGISMAGGSSNLIFGNTLRGGNTGMSLGSPLIAGNTIYHNNFIGNAVQVSLAGAGRNSWNIPYSTTGGGNYYSDFVLSDAKAGPRQNLFPPGVTIPDNIVDTARVFDTNNIDQYPFKLDGGWEKPIQGANPNFNQIAVSTNAANCILISKQPGVTIIPLSPTIIPPPPGFKITDGRVYQLPPNTYADPGAIISFTCPGSDENCATTTICKSVGGGTCLPISPLTVDSVNGTISAFIGSSSIFALLEPTDSLPPRTVLNIGEPKYAGGTIYISSKTALSFAAWDDGLVVGDGVGLGVDKTYFAVDSDTFTVFISSFNITGEGAHVVKYYSTDISGNTETVKTASVTVDNTPPVTVFSVLGSSLVIDGNLYVTNGSSVALAAADGAAGVKEIYYSLDGAAGVAVSPVSLLPGAGAHTLEFYAADNLGNTESRRTLAFFVDAAAPVTTASLAGVAGANGWHISPVTVTLASTDSLSGFAGVYYSIDGGPYALYGSSFTVSAEGGHLVKYYAVDKAGNREAEKSLAFKIDLGKPVVTAAALPAPNLLGWNNTPVAIVFTGTDAVSGIAYCSSSFTVSAEGLNIPVSGYCLDYAGWSSTSAFTVNIDTTKPVLSSTRTPANADGWNNGDVTVCFVCTDNLSGIGSCPGAVTYSAEGVNISTSVRAWDLAGNYQDLAVGGINIDKNPPVSAAALTGTYRNGWYSSSVSVILTSTDALSGIKEILYSLDGAGYAVYQQPIVVAGEGNHTLRYYARDKAGNTETGNIAEFKIDTSAPVVTYVLNPAANAYGWNNTPVSVVFSGIDAISGVAECSSQTVSSEVSPQLVAGWCRDAAGNIGYATATVNIDLTKPVISAVQVPAPNSYGWNNTPVEVLFAGSDALSGLAYCEPAKLISGEGANQAVSGYCMDYAGLSSTTTYVVSMDTTAPLLAYSRTPANTDGWNNSDVIVSFTCTDDLSGVGSCPVGITYSAEGVNISTTVRTLDLAGNFADETVQGINIDKAVPISAAALAGTVRNGWYSSAVSVTLTSTDTLSGVKETYYSLDGGQYALYQQALIVSADGLHEVQYYSVDKAGNIETAGKAEFKIDTGAPVVGYTLNPPANAAGWNNSAVSVKFAGTDAGSGIEECSSGNTSAEGKNQQIAGWCRDLAGNVAYATATVSVDLTMPAVSASQAPAKNANGWNNSDVLLNFTCTDNLSGIGSCPAGITYSAEGLNISTTVRTLDLAGNFADETVQGVNIDKTVPVSAAALAGTVRNGWYSSAVTVTLTSTDTLSGVKGTYYSLAGGQYTLYTQALVVSADGLHEVRYYSTDKAGNSEAAGQVNFKIDTGVPAVAYTLDPPANAAGWNSASVSVIFAGTDGGSGIEECSAGNTSSEGKDQQITGWCRDLAGNIGYATATVSVDLTIPAVSASQVPVKNANGWNNGAVEVSFTGADALSGIAYCEPAKTISTEGASQTVSGYCMDYAGLSSTTAYTASIDITVPVITHTRTPANADGWNNGDVTVSFTCSDSLSGIGNCPAVITYSAEGLNISTTVRTLDLAGNFAEETVQGINIDKAVPVSASALAGTYRNGWYASAVTVTLTSTDTLSGVKETYYSLDGGPHALYTQALLVSAEGSHEVQYYSVDKAGNIEITAKVDFKIDTGVPAVSYTLDPPANIVGWNSSAVSVIFAGVDAGSNIEECSSVTLTAEGRGQQIAGWCRDFAGNIGYATATVSVDLTIPTVSASQSPAKNTNGWNNGAVEVSFAGTDALSGIAYCEPAKTISTEGSSQTVSGYCVDYAGLSSTVTHTASIDVTVPAITHTRTPANADGWNNSDVAVSFTCTDNLSGIASCPTGITYSAEGVNISTTVRTLDLAGNFADKTVQNINIDKAVPVSAAALVGTVRNGWYSSAVTVTLTSTDTLSGVKGIYYSLDGGQYALYAQALVVSADGSHEVQYYSVDKAGNIETAAQVDFKIDTGVPAVGYTLNPPANAAGWNSAAVSVIFAGTDAGSGIEECSAGNTSSEGKDQLIAGWCRDLAGNIGYSTATVSVDLTIPAVSASQAPAKNINGWNNGAVEVSFTGTDALSGIAYCELAKTISTEGANQTVSGYCLDYAGLSSTITYTASIDVTVPVITHTRTLANSDGWNNSDVAVSFTCTDSLSGIASCPAGITYSAEGVNISTTVRTLDLAGNFADETVQGINIDKAVPVSAAALVGTVRNGWYSSAVTVTLTSTDALSDVKETYYSLDAGQYALYAQALVVSADGLHEVRYYSTDKAGNIETAAQIDFKIDTGAPAVAYTLDPPANAAGWNNSAVSVKFAGTDAGSGIEECSSGNTSAEGKNQQIAGWCRDLAGNVTYATATVSVDLTMPAVSASQAPAKNANGWNNGAVEVSFAGTDTLSGIAYCEPAKTISTEGAGQTVSGYCVDHAGLSSTTTYIVSIDTTAPLLAYSRTLPNAEGWNNTDVTVGFECSDGLSGIKSCPGAVTYSAEGVDISTTVRAWDLAGNYQDISVAGIKIDKTRPVSAAALSGTYRNGWYSSVVNVMLSSTDTLSGVKGTYYSVDGGDYAGYQQTLNVNGEGAHEVRYYSVDAAGNIEAERKAEFRIDTLPPAVGYALTPPADAAGWNNSAVSVAFTGTDALSGVEECSSGDISAEGAGQQLAGWCRDAAGNIGITTAVVNVDLTVPAVSAAQTPAPNAAGWNKTPVLAAFAGSDAVSGIASCTPDITISVETSSRIVRGYCTDYAGWSSSAALTISIDTTAPSLAYSRTLPNAYGWNNTDVAVYFACNDNLSGVKRCPDSVALTVEAGGISVSGEAEDLAGNLAAITVSNINIDKRAPDITITAPIAGAKYTNGINMVDVNFSVTDGLSGVRVNSAYLVRTEDKGVPGGDLPAVIAATDGASLNPLDLDDGLWRLTVSATDFADNAAALAGGTFEVVHDTVAPVTGLAVGAPQFISGTVTFINTTTPLTFSTTDDLLLTGDGAGTGVAATYVSLGGGPFTAVTGPVFISTEGVQSVAYYSVDRAGNREATKAASFTVNATAPLIALNFPATGAEGLERAMTGVIAVKGSVSDPILSAWTLEYAAGADAVSGYVFITSGSAAADGLLAFWNTTGLAGDYTLRLRAVDSVENASAVRANVFIGAPYLTAAIGRWEQLKVDLKHPRGIAVTADGLIWVSDTDNNRLLQLTEQGDVLVEIGGKRRWQRHSEAGGGGKWEDDADAELSKPHGLTVDSAGYIYVADTDNHRVLKLSSTGQILLEIGRRTGRWDHPGPGRKPGEFILPMDVAVSAAGLIYVADKNNGRVQVFGPAGDLIKVFATGVVTNGKNAAQSDEPDEEEGRECDWPEFSKSYGNSSQPFGLALNTVGDLWVSDANRGTLLRFDPEGALLQTIDGGNAGLKRPGGLDADSKDAVYAADLGGGGLFKFAPSGELLLNFGGKKDGQWWLRTFAPAALDFTPRKDLWVADTFHNRIIRYSITPSSFTPSFTPFDENITRNRREWGLLVKKGIAAKKGGQLRHDKGAAVEIPAGALAGDADASIEEIAPPVSSAQVGLAARGAAYEFGPDKAVFKTPVTISLPYDSYDPSKESLSVAYWNAEAGNWELLESEIDQSEKKVKAKTGHFSVYQMMASIAAGAGSGMGVSDFGAPSAGPSAEFRLGEVYVFPNPAKGAQVPIFHIETGIADSVNIKIYTVSGRQAHEHTLAGLPAEVDDGNGLSYAYEYAWRDHIPSGVYYYSIEAKKGGQKLKKAGKFAVVR